MIDEDLPLAVDILSDMTLHATLDEGELNKERGVILEEISMEEDSPEDVVHELLSRVQFGDQAAGMPILGPAEQIAAYTRGDLAAYRAKHYHPENCVVALGGQLCARKGAGADGGILRRLGERGPGRGPAAMAPLTGQAGRQGKGYRSSCTCAWAFPAPNWAATSCIPCPL